MSLSVSNAKESFEKWQHCLMGVSARMTGSKLKLNPSKTEFLLIGTKLQREKFFNNFPCLILGKTQIHLHQLKFLVYYSTVALISENTYSKHVWHASIISVTFVEFEKVCPLDLAKQIAVALVGSKLDYCNTLFHNIPEKISLDYNAFKTALQEW